MENFPGYVPERGPADDSPELSSDKDGKKDDKGKKSSSVERGKEPEKDEPPKRTWRELLAEAKKPESEVKEADEKAAPDQELSEEEMAVAASAIAEARLEEINPTESETDAAAAAFMEKVAELGLSTDETLAQAADESLQELGLEAAKESSEVLKDPESDVIPQLPADDTEANNNTTTTAATGSGIGNPPSPPTGSGGPNLPPVDPPGPGASGSEPNFNTLSSNNVPNQPPEVKVEHRAVAPYFLLGYLLGRRRGRIKTEKKLLPMQHKLEKQIGELQHKIDWHELKIRQDVQQQLEQEPQRKADVAKRTTERAKQKPERETSAEKQVEKMGKVAVDEERAELKRQPITPERITVPAAPKKVELLTTPEVLAIAEHISVEASNVAKLYKANRLDDKGLREVVRTYLAGERYEKILHDYLRSPDVDGAMKLNNVNGSMFAADAHEPHGDTQETAREQNYIGADRTQLQNSKTAVEKLLSNKAALAGIVTTVIILALLFVGFILR